MLALNEVQPAFGVNEEELEAVVQNGIIHFDNSIHVRRSPHSDHYGLYAPLSR